MIKIKEEINDVEISLKDEYETIFICYDNIKILSINKEDGSFSREFISLNDSKYLINRIYLDKDGICHIHQNNDKEDIKDE